MKKRSPKSESTRKTAQDRPLWKILTSINSSGQSQQMLTSLGLTWWRDNDWRMGAWGA